MYFSYERYVAVEITILGKCAVKETSLIFFIFVFSQINQTSLCTANYILFQRNISLIKAKMFFFGPESRHEYDFPYERSNSLCGGVN